MRISLLYPYSDLPGPKRSGRGLSLARELAERGHEVTLLVSGFDHATKSSRSIREEFNIGRGVLKIRSIESGSYKRNISVSRIFFERAFGEGAARELATMSAQDLLVLHEPAAFWAPALLSRMGTKRARYVLDVIDMWPEMFRTVLPRQLKWVGEPVWKVLERARAKVVHDAAGIVSVSEDYLPMLAIPIRTPTRVVYWGIDLKRFESEVAKGATLDDTTETTRPRLIYSGSIGEKYDMRTLLDAACLLQQQSWDGMIEVAGTGPLAGWLAKEIGLKGLGNIRMHGTLHGPALASLYRSGAAGLATYSPGSAVSMPIKAFDYFAAELPIITSVELELGRIVTQEQVGQLYRAGSAESLSSAIVKLSAMPRDHAMRGRLKALAQRLDSRSQYTRFAEFLEGI